MSCLSFVLFGSLLIGGCSKEPSSTQAPQQGDTASNSQLPAAPTQTQPAKPKYSRDELKNQVQGKTSDKIIEILGRPARTQEDGNSQWWYYHNLTYDKITGKADDDVQIVFQGGSVTDVTW
jgi:outer membrane protein assembly factor BamE (lipoprotein component of BamABCDE complex)